MSHKFVPKFKCTYCGEDKNATLFNEGVGVFVPCGCKESQQEEIKLHYINNERKRQKRGKR